MSERDADLPDEHRTYWGANLERERSVKETYDPEGCSAEAVSSGRDQRQ